MGNRAFSDSPLAVALRALLEDHQVIGWRPVLWAGQEDHGTGVVGLTINAGFIGAEQARAALAWADDEDRALQSTGGAV